MRRSRVELATSVAEASTRERRDLAFFILGGACMGLLLLFAVWAARVNRDDDWAICQQHARFHGIAIARYCPELARHYWADVD